VSAAGSTPKRVLYSSPVRKVNNPTDRSGPVPRNSEGDSRSHSVHGYTVIYSKKKHPSPLNGLKTPSFSCIVRRARSAAELVADSSSTGFRALLCRGKEQERCASLRFFRLPAFPVMRLTFCFPAARRARPREESDEEPPTARETLNARPRTALNAAVQPRAPPLRDLWEDSSTAVPLRRRRSPAGLALSDVAPWTVGVGHGTVPHRGLSYNPDSSEHAALMQSAVDAEERAIRDARLLAARLLPGNVAASAPCPPEAAAEVKPDASHRVVSPVIVPRRLRTAVSNVTQALRLTLPLTGEHASSLRGMRPISAQLAAAERLSALVLSTGGQVAVRSAVRDGATGLCADDGGVVLVRKGAARRSFPYRQIALPRQAPPLAALAPRPAPPSRAPEADASAAPKVVRAEFGPDGSAPLSLHTGEPSTHRLAAAPARSTAKKGATAGSESLRQRGRGRGNSSAAAAAVLRTGVLSTAEVAGLTLRYTHAQS
jgi:hypothetical protein